MVSKSKSQTQKLAAKLARRLLQTSNIQHPTKATVVALQGELGSGKTAFTQGFCKALGVRHGVASPTFIIFRKHQIPKSKFQTKSKSQISNIIHFDLYRIKHQKELNVLGFKKIIRDPRNIVLIEWPELVKKLLPKNTVWIKFGHGKKQNERRIDFSPKKL